MIVYDILIDYTTGHSFGLERITDESLGIVTTELDKAKENLQRIKKHYENYNGDPNHEDYYILDLLTDEGTRTINPFWIGYFETLHGAKIEICEDPEMSFSLE